VAASISEPSPGTIQGSFMTGKDPQSHHKNQEPLTAREALRLGTERLQREGIESAALDMSLILAEVLGTIRLGLYLNLERPLNPAERDAARKMLARRLKREPVAYILGRREFYGLTFEVTPAVLIPRPETELLVEQAVAWIRERAESSPEPLLTDIGTGSGAIAVAVAANIPSARVYATEISEAALKVARANVEKHSLRNGYLYSQEICSGRSWAWGWSLTRYCPIRRISHGRS
jgi:release factor glutamine methyltransferase